ncbi:MAG TPA: hypothetical protein VGM56_26340 [Byssovorax sp.]
MIDAARYSVMTYDVTASARSGRLSTPLKSARKPGCPCRIAFACPPTKKRQSAG